MLGRRDSNVRRIAILSVHTCPLAMLGGKKTGGMNVYVRDFSRELCRQGYLVDVFTRSQDSQQPMISTDLGNGGRVIHIPAGPEEPLPTDEILPFLEEFAENTAAFAREEGITYDLIHSHYWLSGLVAERLRDYWGIDIPIIQMFHTLGLMKNRVATYDSERAPQNRIDGETHIIHDVANIIIAATGAEEAQLYWLYEAERQKIRIVSPGVDLERFHPIPKSEAKSRLGIPDYHKNILFVGRIEPLKGIDTLLQAISMLQRRHPYLIENVCVSIIGGDPHADTLDDEMERLQALRDQLQIHDLVTFLGSKDQNALTDYYAAAEMVVMPSHYESFGMVALEAMAMGTPVIASEVGGLAFLVKDGETGYHVPSRDPEALADRIYKLLLDDETHDRLGRQALVYAQRFDWCHIVDQIIALYDAALEKSSSTRRREEDFLRIGSPHFKDFAKPGL